MYNLFVQPKCQNRLFDDYSAFVDNFLCALDPLRPPTPRAPPPISRWPHPPHFLKFKKALVSHPGKLKDFHAKSPKPPNTVFEYSTRRNNYSILTHVRSDKHLCFAGAQDAAQTPNLTPTATRRWKRSMKKSKIIRPIAVSDKAKNELRTCACGWKWLASRRASMDSTCSITFDDVDDVSECRACKCKKGHRNKKLERQLKKIRFESKIPPWIALLFK